MARSSIAAAAAVALLAAATPALANEGRPVYAPMADFDLDTWFNANFNQPGSFSTGWRARQAQITPEGTLKLNLRPAPEKAGKPFIASQIQNKGRTRYGRYETVMKASDTPGLISTFFVYTGPWYKDPHHEIDIEILGIDTTKLFVNTIVDGKKLPGEFLDLGFDAAEDFHLYAFEWSEEGVTWFVDGREVFSAPAEMAPPPSISGRIHIDIWGGAAAQKNWSGVPAADATGSVEYRCVSFRPLGSDSRQCSDDL